MFGRSATLPTDYLKQAEKFNDEVETYHTTVVSSVEQTRRATNYVITSDYKSVVSKSNIENGKKQKLS
jgi:hypothetical protein